MRGGLLSGYISALYFPAALGGGPRRHPHHPSGPLPLAYGPRSKVLVGPPSPEPLRRRHSAQIHPPPPVPVLVLVPVPVPAPRPEAAALTPGTGYSVDRVSVQYHRASVIV